MNLSQMTDALAGVPHVVIPAPDPDPNEVIVPGMDMVGFTVRPILRRDISSFSAAFSVKVAGFWSDDPIRIMFDRDTRVGGWSARVSNSAGGRDTKEEPDDLKAYQNLALATLAAIGHASAILNGSNNGGDIRRIDQIAAEYREAQRAAFAGK